MTESKARLTLLDWSLRGKMAILLVVASVLPLAVAAFIDIREARQRLISNASALLSARGDQLVHELDTFHRVYEVSTNKFARLPEIVRFCQLGPATVPPSGVSSAVRSALEVQTAADPNVRGLAILDLSGVVRAATESALLGRDLSAWNYVRTAVIGQNVISDVFVAEAEVGAVPSIAYLTPVRRADGGAIAVLVLWVRAEALWQIMKASNALAGPGSFAALFDEVGVRIAHSYSDGVVFHPGGPLERGTIEALSAERRFGARTRELLEQVRPSPEQFDRARAKSVEASVFRGFAWANQKWSYAIGRRFRAVPWTLFYMIPEESVMAQIDETTRAKVAFAVGITLAALVAAALFATALLAPIRALSLATQSLAGGDLNARVAAQRGDEIGRLGTSFNAMADRIRDQAQALQRANDTLEQTVQERTLELVQKTKDLQREIAERTSAEHALRESEQSLATTLHSIGDAVIATDVEGRVVRMNPVAEELTGWTLDEAKGKPLVEVFHIVNEQTRHRLDNPAERILREGRVVGLANHTALIARNGRERPIADSGAPIRGLGREINGAVLVFRDQSEERAMEAMRLNSLHLEAQNQRIQEASRLKSEFLANMSHELRTPLNAIIGFAELIHEGEVTHDMPEHDEFLGDILRSGRHLLQLINDVLDLSKVEAGKLQFQPEAVNLSPLIGEVLGILRATAANKAVRLESEVDPGVADVVLDAARLKQVLYNYVSNALKFTPERGQVMVRVKPETDSSFRLEVEDSGIGIAPEDLGKLFVEFQQLDPGMTKKHAGTGLGLALTKRLVEAQGGKVGVRSELGRGSIFHAILPRRAVVRAPVLALAGVRPVESLDRAGATRERPGGVLVIDDDASSLKLMSNALVQLGHRPRCAPSARLALSLASSAPPSAVILDLQMPEMDGFEFLDCLRKLPECRRVPVIIWSVKDLSADEQVRLRGSAQGILQKGRDVGAALVEALRSFLPAVGVVEGSMNGGR